MAIVSLSNHSNWGHLLFKFFYFFNARLILDTCAQMGARARPQDIFKFFFEMKYRANLCAPRYARWRADSNYKKI